MIRKRITSTVRTRNAPVGSLADSLWRFSGAVRGVALSAAFVAGAAAPLTLCHDALAQQDRRDEQSGDRSGDGSGNGGWLRRAWGQVKPEDEQQPTPPPTPGAQQQAAPGAPAGGPVGEEIVRIAETSEPINVGLLVDFVAKQLDVNIVSDPGLNDQTVIFNGGLSVPRDELLTLLSMLLEQRGYALTADRPGWYVIKQVGNLPVVFGEGPLATTRVIPTPMIRPSSLQDAVSKALGVTEGQAGRVAYLDDLGVMIVTNTPRNIQAVEDLVRAVGQERDRLALHRFELMNISADVAREKVLQLLAGVQGTQLRSPTQPLGEGAQRGAVQVGGGQAGGSLSNLPDRLFVDGSSNSLIFRGTPAEAASLVELIGVVDTPSRLVANRYAVGPAAVQIAQFGEDAGLGPVRYSGNAAQSGRVTSFGGNFGNQGGAQGQTQRISGPRFVVEDNLEAFVYFGTPSQHEQVKELVDAFAENARGARVVVEFYKLKHADAEQVAELLNALIQDPQSRTGESPFLPQAGFGGARGNRPTIPSPTELGLTDTAQGEGGEGESNALTPTADITIEPDTARNQVAVRAPARQQREIAKIVEKLDVRRPQVYIEVQIVSVTANDDFRFAIESQLTPGQSVLFTNFGLTNVPTGNTAQDARVVNPNLAGFTSAIIRSDYVPFVINAFQEVGDTRIISSPRVLVNDNEEATVQSLRVEPFAETTQNASTSVTSQGGTAEAGTILTVTPQISDAGMLNLTYSLELSDFDRSADTAGGLQPPTQTENYDGVVTLPSDATMVVGGLVRERNAKTVQKVPFVGDIPILGELFKRTADSKTQATIYVFITPRIVRDPTFADLRLLTKGPLERVDIQDELPSLEPEFMPTSGAMIAPKRELEPPALEPVEEPAPSEPSAMGVQRLAPADRPRPMGPVVIVNEKERDGR